MTRRLPVFNPALDDSFLDDIQIATPCSASWDDMRGDDRVRHCGDCRMNVYNLSEMTRKEAAELIRSSEGRTCVRLYKRPDGTLLTQDCWARLRAARRRGWVAFAAALAIVVLTQLGVRFAALKTLLRWYNEKTGVTRSMGTIAAPPGIPLMGAPPALPPETTTRPLMGKPAAPPKGKKPIDL